MVCESLLNVAVCRTCHVVWVAGLIGWRIATFGLFTHEQFISSFNNPLSTYLCWTAPDVLDILWLIYTQPLHLRSIGIYHLSKTKNGANISPICKHAGIPLQL